MEQWRRLYYAMDAFGMEVTFNAHLQYWQKDSNNFAKDLHEYVGESLTKSKEIVAAQ